MVLRYDTITVNFHLKIGMLPQNHMKELGYNVIKSEPLPIGDCWFFEVEKDIENRPSYLTESDWVFTEPTATTRTIKNLLNGL